jgi:hypothetical protein
MITYFACEIHDFIDGSETSTNLRLQYQKSTGTGTMLFGDMKITSCYIHNPFTECCGSGMFYPGSRIWIPNFFIPDPDPGSRG